MLTGIQRCMFGLGDKNSMRAIASFVAKETTYAAGYKNWRQMLLFYWSWERAHAPTEHHTYVHCEYLSASLTTLHVTKQNKRERWALLPDQRELPFHRFILHHLAHVLTHSSRHANLWVYVSREVESNLKLTDIIFLLWLPKKKKKAWGMPSFIIIENNISQPCLSPVVCPPKTHTHIHCLRPLWNPFYTKRLHRKETWISGESWMRFISQKDNVARPTFF